MQVDGRAGAIDRTNRQLKKIVLNGARAFPNFQFLGNFREVGRAERLRVQEVVKAEVAAMQPPVFNNTPTVQYVDIAHVVERECVHPVLDAAAAAACRNAVGTRDTLKPSRLCVNVFV